MTDRCRAHWTTPSTLKLLWRQPTSRHGMIIVGVIAVLCVVAPVLSPYSAEQLDWDHIAQAPSFRTAHWFGTDRLGRDLFVRVFQGMRTSLLIALFAAAISAVIGIIWGGIAGYRGGRLGAFMARAIDIADSLPALFFVIAIVALSERGNVYVLSFTIGAFGWFTLARIVRGGALSIKDKEFVLAAIVGGATPSRILTRHILPNIAGPILVYGAFMLGQMMLFESLLSFLGLGIQEPAPSLGGLLNDGVREMESATWLVAIPIALFTLLLASLNSISDGLRDALDSRLN